VVVEVFFHLASKWLKWCAHSLHLFSQIFKIFSAFWEPTVAPTSDDFQICCIRCKGLFFPIKTLQTAPKSAYKCRCYLLLHSGTVSPAPVIYKESVLETKAIPLLRHCNTSLHITTREHTSLPIHVFQKITIICAQKIRLHFKIWYCVVAPSGGGQENLNRCAKLHIIQGYKKPQNNFFKFHVLIAFRWAQTVALHSVYGTTSTNLTVFFSGTL